MKVISSGRVWFYKRIFPLIMLVAFGGFITALIAATQASRNPAPWPIFIPPFLAIGIVMVVMKKLIYSLADRVEDGGDYLLVRFGGEEEQIPLGNIMNVSYSCMNPPRVTLRLGEPCRFGRDVAFIPLMPFSDFLRNLHFHNAVADDLIERVDSARRH